MELPLFFVPFFQTVPVPAIRSDDGNYQNAERRGHEAKQTDDKTRHLAVGRDENLDLLQIRRKNGDAAHKEHHAQSDGRNRDPASGRRKKKN
jgi:hypothetical protein